MSRKKTQHNLTGIPTAIDEIHKVIDSADAQHLESVLPTLESDWKANKKKNSLPEIMIENKTERRTPLVSNVTMEGATFKELLGRILSLQSVEAFEAIMLLFEFMEEKKSFKISKLTGTELLKLSGYSEGARQEHRDRILRNILSYQNMSVSVLDPERTEKNFRNKKNDEGEVYQNLEFLKIKRTVFSKRRPDLIVALEEIEFMPDYINMLPVISRRYLPLVQLRKIPRHSSTDKSRFFIMRVCFKFASIDGRGFSMNLEECMNMGKFYNKAERDKKRLWQPIEKALIIARYLELLRFCFVFRKPSKAEIKKDKLNINEHQEICQIEIDENGVLLPHFYKYIHKVEIYRIYDLNVQIELPLELEKLEAERESPRLTYVL